MHKIVQRSAAFRHSVQRKYLVTENCSSAKLEDNQGATMLSHKTCFKKVAERKAKIIVIGVYDLPNVEFKGLEIAENTLCLGADYNYLNWTYDYVKIQAVTVEVNHKAFMNCKIESFCEYREKVKLENPGIAAKALHPREIYKYFLKCDSENMVEGTTAKIKWKGIAKDMIRNDKFINCIVVADEFEVVLQFQLQFWL